MHRPLSKLALAAAIAAGAAPAIAATPIGDYLNFSGFGTVGYAATSTDQAEFKQFYQPRGANKGGSAIVDSDLGLQLTATANSWLSGTVQMLSVERSEGHLTNEVEWAYVKVKPVDGLTLRGGRMTLPIFATSDSRYVGYANNWLRPPAEVYGLSSLQRLEGGDAAYSTSIGNTTLTVSGVAGKSEVPLSGQAPYKATKVRALAIQWETEWASFRASQTRADVHVYDLGLTDSYKFTDFGVFVDRDDIVAQTEYVMRETGPASRAVVAARGWYAMGGYRFGTLLPYASYGNTRPSDSAGLMGTGYHITGPQDTVSVGLRWDAFKSADVKFQLDHVDTHNTQGASFTGVVTKPVTVGSVAVDFVF